MKRYPAYRDSGMDWIGEIPEIWELKRLKFLVKNLNEKASGETNKIALENIESRSGRLIIPENPTELSGDMKAFKEDDILFSKLRPYLYKVYLANQSGACVGELLVLRSNSSMFPKFLFYRLLSRDFIEIVDSSTYGTKMPRASWEDFIRNLLIPYPCKEEQITISAFLDYKTNQIESLIANKQMLIELLKEERTVLINSTVTRGLDLTVPMKDSGIEWLAEIPEHWRKEKIIRIGDIKGRIGWKGYTIEDLRPEGEGVLVLGATQINKLNRIDLTSRTYISYEKYEESPEIKLYGGEILFVKVGATIGKVAIVPNNIGDATINPNVMIFRNFKYGITQYLYYYFNSDPFLAALDVAKSAGAQDAINQELVKSLWLPLPPIEEQEMICAYLTENLLRIDTSIDLIVKEIELISEYKISLINEAVSGKIAVRHK